MSKEKKRKSAQRKTNKQTNKTQKPRARVLLVLHLERPNSQLLPTHTHCFIFAVKKKVKCKCPPLLFPQTLHFCSVFTAEHHPATKSVRRMEFLLWGVNLLHRSNGGTGPLLFAFPYSCTPALPGKAALRFCVSPLPAVLVQEPSSTRSLTGYQLPVGCF